MAYSKQHLTRLPGLPLLTYRLWRAMIAQNSPDRILAAEESTSRPSDLAAYTIIDSYEERPLARYTIRQSNTGEIERSILWMTSYADSAFQEQIGNIGLVLHPVLDWCRISAERLLIAGLHIKDYLFIKGNTQYYYRRRPASSTLTLCLCHEAGHIDRISLTTLLELCRRDEPPSDWDANQLIALKNEFSHKMLSVVTGCNPFALDVTSAAQKFGKDLNAIIRKHSNMKYLSQVRDYMIDYACDAQCRPRPADGKPVTTVTLSPWLLYPRVRRDPRTLGLEHIGRPRFRQLRYRNAANTMIDNLYEDLRDALATLITPEETCADSPLGAFALESWSKFASSIRAVSSSMSSYERALRAMVIEFRAIEPSRGLPLIEALHVHFTVLPIQLTAALMLWYASQLADNTPEALYVMAIRLDASLRSDIATSKSSVETFEEWKFGVLAILPRLRVCSELFEECATYYRSTRGASALAAECAAREHEMQEWYCDGVSVVLHNGVAYGMFLPEIEAAFAQEEFLADLDLAGYERARRVVINITQSRLLCPNFVIKTLIDIIEDLELSALNSDAVYHLAIRASDLFNPRRGIAKSGGIYGWLLALLLQIVGLTLLRWNRVSARFWRVIRGSTSLTDYLEQQLEKRLCVGTRVRESAANRMFRDSKD
jgi:hypothetical protein